MKSEILCINDGIIFSNAAAAARYYKILPSVLSQHLHGKIKTAAGLAFARVPAESSPADLVEIRRQELHNVYNITNVSFTDTTFRYCTNDQYLQYAFINDDNLY